ncbi:MAG: GNAT family N-acetyltransferase [Promethearchaeota archaeon]
MGRLAIHKNYHRKGFGTDLLRKAIKLGLSISQRIGCRLVIVDAKTELSVLNFYKKMSFKYLKKKEASKIERALEKNMKPSSSTIKMYFDLHQIK